MELQGNQAKKESKKYSQLHPLYRQQSLWYQGWTFAHQHVIFVCLFVFEETNEQILYFFFYFYTNCILISEYISKQEARFFTDTGLKLDCVILFLEREWERCRAYLSLNHTRTHTEMRLLNHPACLFFWTLHLWALRVRKLHVFRTHSKT